MALQTLAVNLIARTGVFERKMYRSRKQLQRFRTTAGAVTSSLIKMGAMYVAARGISRAVRIYSDFEKQLAMVNTMLDKATQHYFPEYTYQIRKLAVEFGETTATLSKGLYDILSASVAAGKAIDVLRVSVMAGKAGMTDAGVAADAITTLLNAYGLQADQALRVSDVLFATVKRGKTTFGELAPQIGAVASLAAIAGVSLEELGAVLATITRTTGRTDIAITGVRGVLRAFLKLTPQAAAAAKELGFELSTTTLRQEGLLAVLEKMSKGTPEQIAQVAGRIQGLLGFSAAIKDLEGAYSDLELATKSYGLTAEAQAKATDTAAHQTNRFGEAMKEIARRAGGAISKVWRPLAKATADTVGGLIELNDWLGRHRRQAIDYIAGTEQSANATDRIAKSVRTTASEFKDYSGLLKKTNTELDKYAKYAKEAAAREELRGVTQGMMGRALAGIQLEVDTRHYSQAERRITEMRRRIAEAGISPRTPRGQIIQEQLREYIALTRALDEWNRYQEKNNRLVEAGKRIWEATRTPLERYEAEIGKLSKLLDETAINWDTYSRAVRIAREELERTTATSARAMAPEMREIRTALVDIPAISMGLSSQNTELQKQTGLLEQINVNTREAVKEDIG